MGSGTEAATPSQLRLISIVAIAVLAILGLALFHFSRQPKDLEARAHPALAVGASIAGKPQPSLSSTQTREPQARAVAEATPRLAAPPPLEPSATAGRRNPKPQGGSAASATTFRDRLRDGGFAPVMVVIPAGTFMMGASIDDPRPFADELPRHRVTVQPFAVSQTEVTYADYERFARATQRGLPGERGASRDTTPAIVTWREASDYAAWLTGQTGAKYRLPSESEWEYAARASTTTAFSVGPCITFEQANFDDFAAYGVCPTTHRGLGEARAVAAYPPNAFQLHDVSGNVWEWVQDCYVPNYDRAPDDGSAFTQGDCGLHVMRGGSWASDALNVRSSNRSAQGPDFLLDRIGLRVARDL